MKSPKNIEYFITKFLNKEASKEDLLVLEEALKKEKNLKLFNEFIKTNYIGNTLMENFNIEEAKQNIRKRIERDKKVKQINLLKKATAIAAIFIVGTFFYNKFFTTKSKNTQIIAKTIKPGTDKAILTLESGKNLVLEKGKELNLSNSSVKGKEIIYKNDKVSKKEELAYNYLTVPRGGQYFLILSDGTKVWLNSETKLKYPVKFAENTIREVSLLYGEAYFEVSPSTQHKGAKFKVHTKQQNLTVYGTAFNIKAYNESPNIYTTLVEGSISVTNGLTTQRLTPNTQSIVSNNNIEINKTVNIVYVTAWKNGMFMFYKEKLSDMLKSLSRWYDVEIEYKNENKKDEVFSGLLKRTDSIEELLTILEKTGEVNFTINQKKIIVN